MTTGTFDSEFIANSSYDFGSHNFPPPQLLSIETGQNLCLARFSQKVKKDLVWYVLLDYTKKILSIFHGSSHNWKGISTHTATVVTVKIP